MESKFYQEGSFQCIDGPAKKSGLAHSNMKVCFTCRDSDFLKSLLAKVAQDQECYWVKISTKPRDGMFLGRCFFSNKERAAQLWAKYKKHPRLMVTMQDDDFASKFRASVESWEGKSPDAFE